MIKSLGFLLAMLATSQHALSLAPEILGRLIHACAPGVNPELQAAVVAVESNGNAWILHDNNTSRVYRPSSLSVAVRTATKLISSNRSTYGNQDSGVDIGLAQINSRNLPGLNVTVRQLLDPCENLSISSHMLNHAYRMYGSWDAALSTYNSGKPSGDASYIASVHAATRSRVIRATIASSKTLSRDITSSNETSEFLRRDNPKILGLDGDHADHADQEGQTSEFYTRSSSTPHV